MIANGLREIAQAACLGHMLEGKIAAEVEQRPSTASKSGGPRPYNTLRLVARRLRGVKLCYSIDDAVKLRATCSCCRSRRRGRSVGCSGSIWCSAR
jgi:hypothetical protein